MPLFGRCRLNNYRNRQIRLAIARSNRSRPIQHQTEDAGVDGAILWMGLFVVFMSMFFCGISAIR
jgi:hypothetical protein